MDQAGLPLAGEEEDVVVGPEGHENTRGLVDSDRLDVRERAGLPERHLVVAHLAEARRGEAVLVAHPDDARALCMCEYAHDVHIPLSSAKSLHQTWPDPWQSDNRTGHATSCAENGASALSRTMRKV